MEGAWRVAMSDGSVKPSEMPKDEAVAKGIGVPRVVLQPAHVSLTVSNDVRALSSDLSFACARLQEGEIT